MTLYDKDAVDRIKEQSADWAANAQAERQDEFSTLSGVPIQRLYTPADSANLDYARDLGLPGEYPYTRGVHPTMHRGRLWTMRMFAGFGTAEETNAALQISALPGPDRAVRGL